VRARTLARLVAVAGAVGIGWFLLDARPRDVVLVYDASAVPGATAVMIEIRRRGSLVRRADLRLDPGQQARHPVRLPDGTYQLAWRALGDVISLHDPASVVSGERDLVVAGEGTIVLPLAP